MLTQEEIYEYEAYRLAGLLIDNAFYIQAMDKQLILVYDGGYNGLVQGFKDVEDLRSYIIDNIDNVFYSSIEKVNDGKYVLNIALPIPLCYFVGKNGCLMDKSVVSRALSVFMPIINRFMAEAISNQLDSSKFAMSCFYDKRFKANERM